MVQFELYGEQQEMIEVMKTNIKDFGSKVRLEIRINTISFSSSIVIKEESPLIPTYLHSQTFSRPRVTYLQSLFLNNYLR